MRLHDNSTICRQIGFCAFLGLWLGLGLVQPVSAAVSNLRITSATATQIAVSFTITAPGSACTIEISEESDYTPLMTDVDTTLYSGADQCNRASSVAHGNNYTVVLGKRGAEAIDAALDGYTRSRALYADAAYYIRVTNGSAAEITARTPNIMLGTTTADKLATLRPFQYRQVSPNKIVNPMFADPYTGARIHNPAATLGYGYSISSENVGVSNCNISIAGTPTIKPSCRFTDAVGSNWTATTGTLTDAILANDDNFAEYSGTAREKLFVRYGTGRLYTHGTYGATLAAINLGFRAKASANGEVMEVCWTFNGVDCNSPWRTVTLTTTEANYVVCHDSPCTTQDNPGDVMIDAPGLQQTPGQAKIYNASPNWTTIMFAGANATAACNELAVGEKITSTDLSQFEGPQTFTVTAKDCGASPPQFTSSETYNWSASGTTGVPYWRYTGYSSQNWNLGILIRKQSTVSAETISVDTALFRHTYSMFWRYNSGAGGFGRNCQNVKNADGYYLCMGGYEGNIIFGIKPSADGKSLDFRNYGFAFWQGSQLSGNLTSATVQGQFSNTNYAMWDDETAGVFYVQAVWSGGVMNGKNVLVKLTMNMVEKTATDPDAADPLFNTNKAPKVGLTSAVILTPCLNTCANAEDDTSLSKQRTDFSAAWTATASRFPACKMEAVQKKNLFVTCTNGVQDSYAWVFVYDLGNRLPIGSGFVGTHGNTIQLYSAMPLHDTPTSRWSALHTFQAPAHPGGSPFTLLEATNKCQLTVTGTALSACTSSMSGGTCSACPNVTLDGVNYNGRNMCSTITFTSSDPGGVSGFESGDPVNAINCDTTVTWLQKLEVGDFLNRNNGSSTEYIRLIERTDNQNWTIIRGFGWQCPTSTCPSSASFPAVSHANGATWQTKGGNIVKDPTKSSPLLFYGIAWYPALSTDGQNELYNFLNPYQNHGVNGIGCGVAVEAGYQLACFDFTDPAANKASFNAPTYNIIGATFAGKSSFCYGNSCERHPSSAQVNGTTNAKKAFADIHPRMFTGTSSNNEQPLVAGKTYIRVYTETPTIDFRHYDIEHFSGSYPLERVDTLTDSVADSGKYCIAVVADDCFSGSTAGKLYMVNEAFSTVFSNGSTATCRQTQFGTGIADACAANASPASATLAQYEFTRDGVSYGNGSRARVLAKEWRAYREAATENTKADPDGVAFLNRGHWYVMNQPWPGPDSRNRATFNPLPIPVPDPIPPGTDNVLVQFGRNDSFQCSNNRDNSCYAESATISEATPFKFDHETLTGVSCASGCTVALPLIPGRMTYYRLVYRNSGGTVIHRGPTQVTAVQ